jgi:hypothetical protein
MIIAILIFCACNDTKDGCYSTGLPKQLADKNFENRHVLLAEEKESKQPVFLLEENEIIDIRNISDNLTSRSLITEQDNVIVLTKPAIWINNKKNGFAELITMDENECVYNSVATKYYIVFNLGDYNDGLYARYKGSSRSIVYRKNDGSFFEFQADYAIEQYLLRFEISGDDILSGITGIYIIEIKNNEPHIVNYIATQMVSLFPFFSDNFLIDEIGQGIYTIYRWEGIDLVKQWKTPDRIDNFKIIDNKMYYTQYGSDNVTMIDLNNLIIIDLGAGYINSKTNEVILNDNISGLANNNSDSQDQQKIEFGKTWELIRYIDTKISSFDNYVCIGRIGEAHVFSYENGTLAYSIKMGWIDEMNFFSCPINAVDFIETDDILCMYSVHRHVDSDK